MNKTPLKIDSAREWIVVYFTVAVVSFFGTILSFLLNDWVVGVFGLALWTTLLAAKSFKDWTSFRRTSNADRDAYWRSFWGHN